MLMLLIRLIGGSLPSLGMYFDCMLIVRGCFIFNNVGFEVSRCTRKAYLAYLHLGMDPWIHSRYYIKVVGLAQV